MVPSENMSALDSTSHELTCLLWSSSRLSVRNCWSTVAQVCRPHFNHHLRLNTLQDIVTSRIMYSRARGIVFVFVKMNRLVDLCLVLRQRREPPLVNG